MLAGVTCSADERARRIIQAVGTPRHRAVLLALRAPPVGRAGRRVGFPATTGTSAHWEWSGSSTFGRTVRLWSEITFDAPVVVVLTVSSKSRGQRIEHAAQPAHRGARPSSRALASTVSFSSLVSSSAVRLNGSRMRNILHPCRGHPDGNAME